MAYEMPQSRQDATGSPLLGDPAAFSGKRLAVKDRKTAVPIFYPPSFTS
jgi:hypothetical protein